MKVKPSRRMLKVPLIGVAAFLLGSSVLSWASPAYAGGGTSPSTITLSESQIPAELSGVSNVIFVSDAPLHSEVLSDAGTVVTPMDADCSAWWEICGIVYNRSGYTLQLRRDAGSRFGCEQVNDLHRNLPSGQDSNKVGSPTWPDVDCFRHHVSGCTLFYAGTFYSAGAWIRIHNSVWVYNINC